LNESVNGSSLPLLMQCLYVDEKHKLLVASMLVSTCAPLLKWM
jgi:hypothetical protein